MKFTLLILVFGLTYCYAQLMAASKTCSAELKVPEKDITEFFEVKEKFDAAPENMQCVVKCLMEKLGHSKDGVLDVDKTMKDWKEIPELKKYNVTDPKVFANCKNEKGKSNCETAYKITKCLRLNKPAK